MAVFVDGLPVVDLVGGWADADRTRAWAADTLVDVYSVGKALVALLALQLVDEGRIGLDDPVASMWPEFAAGGKAGATVRHALCHRAGRPGHPTPLTNEDLWDWDTMADRAGRHRGVVGAGDPPRLPHQHLRPPGGRAGPTGGRRPAR